MLNQIKEEWQVVGKERVTVQTAELWSVKPVTAKGMNNPTLLNTKGESLAACP